MQVVKLNATVSTNKYIRDYCRDLQMKDDVLVWALAQEAGKGQMGSRWEAEPGKNLTFSVFRALEGFKVRHQFYITMATSLAISQILREIGVSNLAVKWPNDILAGSQKICGILIESVIKAGKLSAVIIGVGLNVNQEVFKYAPRATSLKLETERYFDLEELLQRFIKQFYYYSELLATGKFSQIKSEYESLLFRKDKVSTFRTADGNLISGIIQGVAKTGKLKVRLDDELIKEFDLKEIQLLY